MDGTAAKRKLEEAIAGRMATAQDTIKRVLEVVPQDAIVTGRALQFRFSPVRPSETRMPVIQFSSGNLPEFNAGVPLHRHALGQVAEKGNIPVAYLEKLGAGERWQRDLASDILTRTYQNQGGRYLLRQVPGPDGHLEARGFLSDKYRRLDTRPLLDAFIGAAQQAGAVPFAGVSGDIKVAVKALLPQVMEPMAGEFVALGIEWANSDFGAARLSLRAFFLRIVCINGATAEDLLSQVHLGGRLPEEIEFSRRTYELDTRAMVSATQDVVRSALAPGAVEAAAQRVRHASEVQMPPSAFLASVAKALTKEEAKHAQMLFEGPDVLNLPPGNTAWRASNALSWLANTAEGERRLDLERLAGEMLKAAV